MSITVAELFPRYRTASKWMKVWKPVKEEENIRLEKEYTIHSIRIYPSGDAIEQYVVDENRHHRSKPSYLVREGTTTHEGWYVHGKPHRVGGPAKTEYDGDDDVCIKEWFQYGRFYREDGPAYILTKDGQDEILEWYMHGDRHRKNGPASIVINGNSVKMKWYIRGMPIDPPKNFGAAFKYDIK